MAVKQHDFEADTGKILDIVIHSLYSEKEIFLRELISTHRTRLTSAIIWRPAISPCKARLAMPSPCLPMKRPKP